MLGDVNEEDIGRLALQLGVSRTNLTETIDQIAIGGLLDIQAIGVTNTQVYKVEPRVLANNLAAEFFFGKKLPPVTPDELFEEWPHKRIFIATTTSGAGLLRNNKARITAQRYFDNLSQNSSISNEYTTFLHYYLHLGESEANQVLELVAKGWNNTESREQSELTFSAQMIAQYIVEAFADTEFHGAAKYLLAAAKHLRQNGSNSREIIKEVVDGIRGFGPDERLRLDDLVALWTNISITLTKNGPVDDAIVAVLCEAMSPSIEASWIMPEDPRSIQFASGFLLPDQMEYLETKLWNNFERLNPSLTRSQLETLVPLVSNWGSISRKTSVTSGDFPSNNQMVVASRVTARVANWIFERSPSYPGIPALVREHARGVSKLPIEHDPFIEAMFSTRELHSNFRELQEMRQSKIESAITPYLDRPDEFISRIEALEVEFRSVQTLAISHPLWLAFRAISDSTTRYSEWFLAARAHGFVQEAGVLLAHALQSDQFSLDDLTVLFTEPHSRGRIIDEALARNEPDSVLGQLVISGFTPEDAETFQHSWYHSNEPSIFVESLLQHRNSAVRSSIAAAMLAISDDSDTKFDTEVLSGAWKKAISELEIPVRFNLTLGKHDFFEKLARIVPDVYEQIFIRKATETDFDSEWHFFTSSFAEAASSLPRDSRTRVWEAVSQTRNATRLFRLLATNDTEWITELLNKGQVDPKLVLDSVNGLGLSPTIEELARILVPYGIDPEQIAWKLDLGTFFGQQHEHTQSHLDKLREMEASDDPSVQAVGHAGIPYYEKRYDEELQEARFKEIRGEL